MRRARVLVAAAVAVGLAGAALSQAPVQVEAAAKKHEQPYLAIDADFPDPALLRTDDGTYYSYATNEGSGNVPVATATDPFGDWTRLSDALPTLGAWAKEGFTWAPDVTELADGTFLLYYTARDIASDRQCVGAATATDPAGPFTPVGDDPLVCPVDEGGAIDAAAFVDADGTRYLTYKNDGNAIGVPTYLYLQQVGEDGITFVGGRIPLLENDPDVEGGLVEAPYLVKHKKAYYLFYSYGHYWDDTYTTGYAVAKSLHGPYVKADEPLMSTQTMRGKVIGPGGASFLPLRKGADLVAFHGVINTPSFHRGMYIAKLKWRGAKPVVVVK